jgi:ATP-dependent Lon protease
VADVANEFLTAETAQEQSSDGPAEKSKGAGAGVDENAVYLLLPLQETVIFPGMVITLPVENAAVASAIEEMLPNQRRIVLSAFKAGREEVAGPEDLHRVGAFGRIMQMMRRNETLVLAVEAQERVSLEHLHQREGFWQVNVRRLESTSPPASDQYWQAAVRNLRDSALRLVRSSETIPKEAEPVVQNFSIANTGLLTDFLAANLALSLEQKQALLEETQVVRRVDRLQKFLNEQLHITDLQAKLREDVKTEFTEAQRRAFLREQLRAIQKELGEDDGNDSKVADLETKIAEAKLPETAQKQADRELRRLQQLSPSSPEYSVIVDYLETIASLPWSKMTEDQLDLRRAQEVLDRDHYGIEKIKRRIIEYLAVRKLNPTGRGPILCFLGPPGVGKTSLGQSIASALGREFIRIALGGARDEAEIRGHRRTYIGAMPGRIIQELRRAGTRNPVIMLDELDKLGADFRGDPASALLEVLDPRQNQNFVDRYLDLPFDLSQVVFIATANMIEPIPAPLRDRMEVIRLAGYTPDEKRNIAERYLIPRQLEENGVTAEQCTWAAGALQLVIDGYTREAGVRNLEREIGSVVRATAAAIARGDIEKTVIDENAVEDALGPVRFQSEKRIHQSAPGVVNGLAYTPVGGEVLHIEAIRYPGKGSFTLTGQLGDVMKESVKAAESLVRSRADKLGINPEEFGQYDVHVHVPAGAIPKDGPSAGVAMFTALASLFSNRPVNHEVGMTGEITLRGLVLPIGGLKEKTLAALNAGIKTVLIPRQNEKDIPELAEQVKSGLTIIPVDTVDEVLEFALLPAEQANAQPKHPH